MSEKYKSATPSVQVVETICARKSPWTRPALCPIMGFLICNFSLNCYFHDRCFTNLHSDSVLFNNKQKLPKWGGQNTRACICICQTTIVRSVFWCNLQLWPFQHDLWWTQGMCRACTFFAPLQLDNFQYIFIPYPSFFQSLCLYLPLNDLQWWYITHCFHMLDTGNVQGLHFLASQHIIVLFCST